MKQTYYDLSVHSRRQLFIFFIIVFGLAVLIFNLILPLSSNIIEKFLMGTVYNAGEVLNFTLDNSKITNHTNFYTNWAVDTYIGTLQESRYWINPIYSFSLPVLLFSLSLSLVITTLLPQSIGYMRQKIEREITLALSKISIAKEGQQSLSIINQIRNEILNADLKKIHDFSEITSYTVEDLKILRRSLIWQESSFFGKLLKINHGLQIYMRFYFTEKYSNTVLGMVYLGAAFLIIIIGLRGLKFIPSTQPSLVFFALGLEFSMLITYAFTLMFSRQEEDVHDAVPGKDNFGGITLSNNLGNDKQVESLLRVFIESSDKEK